MLQKIFDFLFGKSPDIFDQNGNVVHKLPKEKWQAWQDRYQKSEEYDWHHHSGEKRGKPTLHSPTPTPPPVK